MVWVFDRGIKTSLADVAVGNVSTACFLKLKGEVVMNNFSSYSWHYGIVSRDGELPVQCRFLVSARRISDVVEPKAITPTRHIRLFSLGGLLAGIFLSLMGLLGLSSGGKQDFGEMRLWIPPEHESQNGWFLGGGEG